MSVEVQLSSEPAPATYTAQPASTAYSCPSCGTPVAVDVGDAEEAKRTIKELEGQMELLREKAAAAGTFWKHTKPPKPCDKSMLTRYKANKCAEYEDQIRALRTASSSNDRSLRNNTSDSTYGSSPDGRPSTATSAHARTQSRFSFLTGRLTSPVNSTNAPPLHAPALKSTADPDLLHELERERALRAKAEDRVRTVDSEIEELSVTLFSQANEMVAEERRARAKLEERIELLEKKDKDKMARLDRLERAVSRLDRVKALLNKGDAPNTASVDLAPPARR